MSTLRWSIAYHKFSDGPLEGISGKWSRDSPINIILGLALNRQPRPGFSELTEDWDSLTPGNSSAPSENIAMHDLCSDVEVAFLIATIGVTIWTVSKIFLSDLWLVFHIRT